MDTLTLQHQSSLLGQEALKQQLFFSAVCHRSHAADMRLLLPLRTNAQLFCGSA